jgi:hypothetical protein
VRVLVDGWGARHYLTRAVERRLLDGEPASAEPRLVDGHSAPIVDPLLPNADEIRRATEGGDPDRPAGSFLDRVVRKARD